ncbi:MAG TPA: hypothetical protein DDW52_23995 [Planctomycetaceae bacterium]|nr:hypothetical protein [Planctomycetaceae bacterium]
MAEKSTTESSGVQQLIDRLHQEGVEKGQTEAEALLASARKQAVEVVDNAKKEAKEILAAAREEAAQTKRAGEEAIRLAGRDSILTLTEELRDGCNRTLQRLIGESLQDQEFLRQLISEIAGQAVPKDAGRLHLEFLADDGEEEKDGESPMDAFAKSLAGQSLREGLTFEVVDSTVPGVRVQVVDEELEIDLTDETLTHLLLKHLSPRFRRILGD